MFPVNYDSCNWKMLSEFLRSPDRDKIPILTRAKLLHDSWNLAYSGELCFRFALNMTLFLKEERSHVVWEPVFMMFDHIGRRIEGSDVYPIFEVNIAHFYCTPSSTCLTIIIQNLSKIHQRLQNLAVCLDNHICEIESMSKEMSRRNWGKGQMVEKKRQCKFQRQIDNYILYNFRHTYVA